MPSYLWSVKSPEGRSAAQRVQAPSPEAARTILESQGFTELKLQDDDFGNILHDGLRIDSPDLQDAEFTPEEELEFMRSHGFWGGLWRTIQSWSWALVPLAVWNSYNIYRGLRWSVSAVAAGALLLVVIYLMVTLRAVSVCYN